MDNHIKYFNVFLNQSHSRSHSRSLSQNHSQNHNWSLSQNYSQNHNWSHHRSRSLFHSPNRKKFLLNVKIGVNYASTMTNVALYCLVYSAWRQHS